MAPIISAQTVFPTGCISTPQEVVSRATNSSPALPAKIGRVVRRRRESGRGGRVADRDP